MLADEGRAYSSKVIAMIRATLTSSRFSGPRQLQQASAVQ